MNRATAKKRSSERMVNTTVPVQTLLVLSPSASIFLPMLHTCMSMTTLYTIIQIQILVLFPFPPFKTCARTGCYNTKGRYTVDII